jgi:PAS domain S-box-containing protein
MNPVAEALTGWKQEEAIGRNLREVFLVEKKIMHSSLDASDVLPGRMSDFFNLSNDSTLISNDGTEKFIESNTAPMKDAAGNISGNVLIFRDITKHIQAREALRVSLCQQAAVAELGRRALAEADLFTLENEAVVLVAQTLDIEYCGVLELLPERDALLLRAGVGWKEGYVGSARLKTGPESQFGYALLADGPVIVQDLPTETRFRASPLLYQHGVISGISVVIHGQDEPFGILSAYSTRRRTLTADDSHFLQAIAHVLAAATERKRAEGTRIRLLERLISAQEEERRRIARELHDEAGQSLTSLLVGLRLIEDAHTIRQARAQANRLRHITMQTLEDTGRLARGLHPSILDDHGLGVALNRYASDFTQSCGIAVNVDSPPADATRLPAPVETMLYRIAQEALTNVAKHAEAKAVTIRLERLYSEVRLTIADDGCGFEVEQTLRAFTTSNHLGLYGMSERAALLRGCIAIKSKQEEGTTVLVRIPCEGGERLDLQEVEAGYVGISR